MLGVDTVKRIQSNEYFDAVQDYFAGQQMPSRVYAFLLDILKADKYKLTDDLLDMIWVSIRLKLQTIACASAQTHSVF